MSKKQRVEKAIEEKDIDQLLALMEDSSDTEVQAEAVKGLGMIGDSSVLHRLKNTLAKEDLDKKVKSNIILAVGDLGSEEDVSSIEKFLKADSWVLRHDAAIALGDLGGKKAVKLLKEVIEEETDEDIKRKAVESIGRIGDEETTGFLTGFMDDEEIEREIIEALAEMGDKEAIEPLKEKLKNGRAEIREKSIDSLSSIDGEEVLDIIEELVEDENWRVREEVTKILGKDGTEEHIPLLKELLEDDKIHVREAALESLGELGGEEHVSILKKYIDEPEGQIRASTYMALGNIPSKDSVQCLLEAFRDENHPRILWSIIENLGKIGMNFRKDLKEEMDVHTGDKKIMLSIALAKTGDPSFIITILDAVGADRWKTRQKAVESLREIDLKDTSKRKANKTIKKLQEALYDNDKWVRAEAAKALGDKIIRGHDEASDERLDVEKGLNSLIEKRGMEADDDVRMEIEQVIRSVDENTGMDISKEWYNSDTS